MVQAAFRRRAACALVAATCALLLAAGCSSAPKNESPDATAERLYREARDDIEAGSYDRAIKSLERVEGLAAGTLLAQQAQIDLAYVQWKANERASALTTIERFIKLNPSSPALDYAMYLRGLINFNDNLGLLGSFAGQKLSERDQRASRDAWQSFKQLVDQFPQSKYTPDAKLRMNYILNSLAEYEVHVARYYYRRGAYVAAANRAQQAVAEFPQAPAGEEALFLMMASYDKLGLEPLREGAERVLRRNYPQSAYLRRGAGDYDRAWWQLW
ncbi:MAG: outer membrane protein assembly factor BamD [Rubrivivax sp.]|nr:outer membrane protein assembly factor BamD [Rubrivivax sp.]